MHLIITPTSGVLSKHRGITGGRIKLNFIEKWYEQVKDITHIKRLSSCLAAPSAIVSTFITRMIIVLAVIGICHLIHFLWGGFQKLFKKKTPDWLGQKKYGQPYS
jgi:hypothetical protein